MAFSILSIFMESFTFESLLHPAKNVIMTMKNKEIAVLFKFILFPIMSYYEFMTQIYIYFY